MKRHEEIDKVMRPFMDATYFAEDIKACVDSISKTLYIKKEGHNLHIDMLEALILSGKVATKQRNFLQALYFANLALQNTSSSPNTHIADECVQIILEALL